MLRRSTVRCVTCIINVMLKYISRTVKTMVQIDRDFFYLFIEPPRRHLV